MWLHARIGRDIRYANMFRDHQFAYGLYAGFALLSLLFVLYAVCETKGIELEDMHA